MVTQEETIQYTKEWIQKVEADIVDLKTQLISDLLSVWPDKQTYVNVFCGYGTAKYFYANGSIGYYSSGCCCSDNESNIKNFSLENLIVLWNEWYLYMVNK